MTEQEKKQILNKMAKKECLKELAQLRASNPDPPMVSQSDLCLEEEDECGRPACGELVADLCAEIESLKRGKWQREVAELRGAGAEEAGPSTRQRRRRAPPKTPSIIVSFTL
uniref:Uncharacterized protein n=1 Tax=Knipowitschia caucasica TaxID=637954 RepID=A0AAV2KIF6_KNICA